MYLKKILLSSKMMMLFDESQSGTSYDADTIKLRIDTGKASEEIVGKRASIIGDRLEKIKNGLVTWASPNDPEYIDFLELYNKLVREYILIGEKQEKIVQELDNYIAKLEGKTNEGITI